MKRVLRCLRLTLVDNVLLPVVFIVTLPVTVPLMFLGALVTWLHDEWEQATRDCK